MHTHTLTLSDLERGAQMRLADAKARIAYFERRLHGPRRSPALVLDMCKRLRRVRFEAIEAREEIIALRKARG